MASTSSTITARITIQNQLGLHARPAMAFVDVANGFKSDIRLKKGSQTVDGKSIMQMMMLGATMGTELELIVDGPDSREAVTALTALVDRKFDED